MQSKSKTTNRKSSYHAKIVLHFAFRKNEISVSAASIDKLISMAGGFPAPSEIEVQKIDGDNNLKITKMDRRAVLKHMLDIEACCQETADPRSTTTKQWKEVLEPILKAAKKFETLLQNEKDRRTKDLLFSFETFFAPGATRALLENITLLTNYLSATKLRLSEFEKKMGKPSTPKNRHLGDPLFGNAIDTACKIWIILFEREAKTAFDSVRGKASGPMVRFTKALLETVGYIPKRGRISDDSIRAAIKKWVNTNKVKLK